MSSEMNNPKKMELFYSYSHTDEHLKQELVKHLSILKRSGVIVDWHDRKISAGTEWKGEIKEHVSTAQIILLLISADFLASNYCYDVEVRKAMERHESGKAKVIPIVLRPVVWDGFPFSDLQALPENSKPITTWDNLDEAFENVAKGIIKVISELNIEQQKASEEINNKTIPKIIVFEDDPQWSNRIENVLKAVECESEVYDHYSEELLRRLGISDYNLLITDINLTPSERSKEGTVLVEFVRVCRENIPIIVITGYPYLDDVLDVVDTLVKSRIDYFFAKQNWNPASFLDAVKTALKEGRNKSS